MWSFRVFSPTKTKRIIKISLLLGLTVVIGALIATPPLIMQDMIKPVKFNHVFEAEELHFIVENGNFLEPQKDKEYVK